MTVVAMFLLRLLALPSCIFQARDSGLVRHVRPVIGALYQPEYNDHRRYPISAIICLVQQDSARREQLWLQLYILNFRESTRKYKKIQESTRKSIKVQESIRSKLVSTVEII